jgi:uncharacterized membrane protein
MRKQQLDEHGDHRGDHQTKEPRGKKRAQNIHRRRPRAAGERQRDEYKRERALQRFAFSVSAVSQGFVDTG